jgi:hypothetical protein
MLYNSSSINPINILGKFVTLQCISSLKQILLKLEITNQVREKEIKEFMASH